jgi:hypothetical protein
VVDEGSKEMKEYRIEIVRRSWRRFGWVFVRIDERGRRVLARSDRSYKSRKRVRQAIDALREARVFDATKGYAPFPLPATGFRLVPGVVPLIVDDSPLDPDDAVFTVRSAKGRKDEEREERAEERASAVAVEEVEVVAAEDDVVETEQKPRTRRRAR